MANEITFGFTTGRDLSYGVYNANGDLVTAATTDLPEIGTTGYYTATNGDIAASDFVIVTDSVLGVVGQGEYLPEVSTTALDADLVAIEASLDELIDNKNMTTNVYNETVKGDTSVPIITYT